MAIAEEIYPQHLPEKGATSSRLPQNLYFRWVFSQLHVDHSTLEWVILFVGQQTGCKSFVKRPAQKCHLAGRPGTMN